MTTIRKLTMPLAAAALSALAACASVPPAPTPASGFTLVQVRNDLGDDYELGSVNIAVDERVLPVIALPPDGHALGQGMRVALPPGTHDITVRAVAATKGKKVEQLVVGTQQSIFVGRGPASLLVRVFARQKGGNEIDERVAVELSADNATLSAALGTAPAHRKDDKCAPRLPVERALCRAAADLEDAYAKHDVVLDACVRPRLAEMRRLVDIRQATAGADVGRLVEDRVIALELEVDNCAARSAVGSPVDEPPPLMREKTSAPSSARR